MLRSRPRQCGGDVQKLSYPCQIHSIRPEDEVPYWVLLMPDNHSGIVVDFGVTCPPNRLISETTQSREEYVLEDHRRFPSATCFSSWSRDLWH